MNVVSWVWNATIVYICGHVVCVSVVSWAEGAKIADMLGMLCV